MISNMVLTTRWSPSSSPTRMVRNWRGFRLKTFCRRHCSRAAPVAALSHRPTAREKRQWPDQSELWNPAIHEGIMWPVWGTTMKLLTEYLEHALTFERMAAEETNPDVKAQFERQAAAYRK